MITDDLGKQLHDRATRGQPLSAEERAVLNAWYARHDEEECKLFSNLPAPSHVNALREQVNATLGKIVEVAQYIQTLNHENEALRKEIALLEQRLIQKAS